jgi:threonine dehydrogenase-like Zn-dependent dehydrogenase
MTGDAQVTGRAVVLERFGEPLVLREFPMPRPPLGGMVVASRYGGVCGTDLHLQQGHLDVPVPLVLGHEGLGVVHELGAGTAHDVHGAPLRIGDRVMWASSIACGQCVPCRCYREPTLCERRRTYGVNRSLKEGEPLSGSWAEYISLEPGTTVVKVPDGIADLAAMAFACAGPTMVHAIQERRPVRLGETVVVQGSGPVGLAAAAMAQLAGASLVGIVGGPEKRLRLARQAGIGDVYINVIDADDPDSVLDEVQAMTGGRGADLVIEATGVPAAVAQGVRMPRRGGSYLVVGQYTDRGDAMLNPHQIVYRQLDVIGSWAFTGAHLAEYVRLLPALEARFDLARLVTEYTIEKCGTALEDVAAGSVMKAVLVS